MLILVGMAADVGETRSLGQTGGCDGAGVGLLGPPAEWAELVQSHDYRDAMQASPDELSVIDIRSL